MNLLIHVIYTQHLGLLIIALVNVSSKGMFEDQQRLIKNLDVFCFSDTPPHLEFH